MDMLSLREEVSGKRAMNRIRNRNAILTAARECFRENGYDNSTIRDIVRRTGLAAGTFYNYFSSKQDIFAALLTDFLSHLNHDMSRHRRTASSTRDFIHNAYLALYTATARDPVVYELAHQNQRALRNLSVQTFSALPCCHWKKTSAMASPVGCFRTSTRTICARLFWRRLRYKHVGCPTRASTTRAGPARSRKSRALFNNLVFGRTARLGRTFKPKLTRLPWRYDNFSKRNRPKTCRRQHWRRQCVAEPTYPALAGRGRA